MFNICCEALEFTSTKIQNLILSETITHHTDAISSIDFSKDGKYFLSAGRDQQVRIYTQNGNECIKTICYPYFLNKVIFTHDSKYLLASSNDECVYQRIIKFLVKIILISSLSEEVIFAFTGYKDNILDITMHPKDDIFISTSNEFETRLWDIGKRTCLVKIVDSVCSAFNPNGRRLVSISEKVSSMGERGELSYINVYLYPNIKEGAVYVTKVEHKSKLSHVMFSYDELWLCLSDIRDNIYILNTLDFGCVLKLQKRNPSHNPSSVDLKFDVSPCSNFIAMAYPSGEVLIWNILEGRVEKDLQLKEKFFDIVKFSPCCKKILISSKSELIIWTV